MAKQTAQEINQANLDDEQAFAHALHSLNDSFSASLRLLLETKHLYQNIVLPYEDIVSRIRKRVISAYHSDFDRRIDRIPGRLLVTTELLYSIEPQGKRLLKQMQLVLSNIKLPCATCDRREAFTPVSIGDIVNDLNKPSQETRRIRIPANFQLWLLTYQCQSCLGPLEGFLVRREGWKLHLEGRSPIENIELPAFLPKTELHWFRDAVVARNSGKVLAGLFYLRTFIEQFARRQTKMDGRVAGVEIMTAYGQLIPESVRSFMPSLRDWYEKLSMALHGAFEDSDLFEDARGQIEKHFDFRRVHGITDNPPA